MQKKYSRTTGGTRFSVSNIQSAGIDLLQCLIVNYDLTDNKEGVGKRRSSTLIVGL
jgi:hypothetical protein